MQTTTYSLREKYSTLKLLLSFPQSSIFSLIYAPCNPLHTSGILDLLAVKIFKKNKNNFTMKTKKITNAIKTFHRLLSSYIIFYEKTDEYVLAIFHQFVSRFRKIRLSFFLDLSCHKQNSFSWSHHGKEKGLLNDAIIISHGLDKLFPRGLKHSLDHKADYSSAWLNTNVFNEKKRFQDKVRRNIEKDRDT